MRNREFVAHLRAQSQHRQRHILLVEDEPDIRDLLKELLETSVENVQVTPAASAEEALALMADFHPDLIVTDYKMPGMHGLDFLARVRQRHPELPCILMTAFPDLDIAIRAINDAHVQSFLAKPLDAEQVVRVVKGVLAAWQEKGNELRKIPASPDDLRRHAPP